MVSAKSQGGPAGLTSEVLNEATQQKQGGRIPIAIKGDQKPPGKRSEEGLRAHRFRKMLLTLGYHADGTHPQREESKKQDYG
jgi:hypothetical protein